LAGFFFAGVFFAGPFLARGAFATAALAGAARSGAASRGAPSATILYTKSFSRTRSRTFMPTSCPTSARETLACSICNVSTVCSTFVVGPWICTVSPIASVLSVNLIAATPIFP